MPSDVRGIGVRLNAFIRRHSVPELLALTGIWGKLALVDVRLKISPPLFKRHWLFTNSPVDCASPVPAPRRAEALRLERLVVEASNHSIFFNMSCLRRALVLRSLLAAREIPSRLVFGVRRSADGGLPAAHAWLELGDLRLGLGTDSGNTGFAAFRHKGALDSKYDKP